MSTFFIEKKQELVWNWHISLWQMYFFYFIFLFLHVLTLVGAPVNPFSDLNRTNTEVYVYFWVISLHFPPGNRISHAHSSHFIFLRLNGGRNGTCFQISCMDSNDSWKVDCDLGFHIFVWGREKRKQQAVNARAQCDLRVCSWRWIIDTLCARVPRVLCEISGAITMKVEQIRLSLSLLLFTHSLTRSEERRGKHGSASISRFSG